MENNSDISDNIRNTFISYFKKNSHHEVLSSPLIPINDPSLLFTNSGMVQFKNWFTGEENPKHKNVVTIQKCLRAGGKHNDLENVGYTPRHHTFFEMLGNFSFGGYFKELAIELAWKLLTKEFQIDSSKLLVTVYDEDTESFNIWKKVSGLDDSKIIKIKSDDNFWSMGDSGPCGPCSEIFYDNGDRFKGGPPGSKNQEGERFVEIWNLVFMQYEKIDKTLRDLPIKCVDTGMGLERITALISNKSNNYETDLFMFIFSNIEKQLNKKMNSENITSFRIISDHIKSICMLMNEGILPSNEGRGYVLRRIIRRSILQVNKIQPAALILNKLVKSVVKKYSNFYFDFEKKISFIEKNLKNEEQNFSETLDNGLGLLKKELKKIKGKEFPAELAFKLYDTYGFPVDVTQNILNEKKLSLDLKKYYQIIKINKMNQIGTWAGSGEKKNSEIFLKLKNEIKKTKFIGYEKKRCTSKLLKIIKGNKFLNSIPSKKGELILVFETTPFYAESGGQVGDTGKILSKDGKLLGIINNTKKIDGDIFLHFLNDNQFSMKINETFELMVDEERRDKISNNHSATHLLHESLRSILGDHVSQKGSLVNEGKLRFDFTYNGQPSHDEILKIEKLVNSSIRMNIGVKIDFMPVKDAIKNGAIALFGEKYPDKARVVSFIYRNRKYNFFSKELCGGTHADSTGQIGLFKIISESSVSSGVRRVEAMTGENANKHLNDKLMLFEEIKLLLKASEKDLKEKIVNLKDELNKLRRKTSEIKINFNRANIINNSHFNVYFEKTNTSNKELKNMCDLIRKKFNSGIIIITTLQDNKVSVVVSVSDDYLKKINAVSVVKKVIEFLGGTGGGGRDDLAQGGAPFSHKYDDLESFLTRLK